VIGRVLIERHQGAETRQPIIGKIQRELGRPVVTFFTSFTFPVMVEDADADMLEGVLQKLDLSNGLALVISSPGGEPLAAERIINVCRAYSGTGEYWAIVPGKAKSAATMICFGASRIVMSPTSELGPVDPQLTTVEEGVVKRFSVHNIVRSYEELFSKAVGEQGNLQPYLQQLQNYDEREIREFKAAIALSEDIAVRTLAAGMMRGKPEADIKKCIELFLTPERKKTHGRPIYREEAATCGLSVELPDVRSKLWKLVYELYIRTDNFVRTEVSKCIESKSHSFMAARPEGK